MARIETDPNYTSPTFSRATAPTDPFKKEDVQQVAAALSTHVHDGVHGLPLTGASIPNGTITSAMIADGTIVAGDIADGAVTSAKILDGTIATADHADASVTNAKLGSDTARLNLLTNGGLEIWQRGNGPFTSNGTFGPDRWLSSFGGGDTLSISADTTHQDVGSKYCAACVNTFVFSSNIQQTIEHFAQLRGKTVTFSARVQSTAVGAVRLNVFDSVNGTRNGSANVGTGAYETLSVTAPIASAATSVTVSIVFIASGTVYVDNAMLVVGSQPADYAPLHPADDLARCLRYYEILSPEFGAYANAGSQGMGYGVPYKAHKPVTPTITKVGTWGATNCGQPQSVTRAGLSGTGLESAFIFATSTAAGYVQFYSFDATCGISVEANP